MRNKERAKAYMKIYRENNRERELAYKKEYRQKHKAEIKEYMDSYRQTHKEKIKKKEKEYRVTNKDKIRERNKIFNAEYYSKPEIIAKVKAYKQLPYVKEKKKGFDKRYYEANKEKIHAHQKIYNETHKEEEQERHKKYREEHSGELKEHSKEFRDTRMQEFISTYKKGKCCEMCGYNEYIEILQFHHKTRDKSFSISTFRRKKPELIKAEIEKCILLCPNCHFWLHYKEHNKIFN